MSLTPPRAVEGHQLADHNVDLRMIILAAMALVVGTGGALGAWVLVKLIAIATNLFWFGRFSAEHSVITDAHVGLLVVAIPIIGSLIVGLMARVACRSRSRCSSPCPRRSRSAAAGRSAPKGRSS